MEVEFMVEMNLVQMAKPTSFSPTHHYAANERRLQSARTATRNWGDAIKVQRRRLLPAFTPAILSHSTRDGGRREAHASHNLAVFGERNVCRDLASGGNTAARPGIPSPRLK